MKNLYLLTLIVFFISSCGTAVEFRKVKFEHNGTVAEAMFRKRTSKMMIEGDKILLKQVGPGKWCQSFNTFLDTNRVERRREVDLQQGML